MSANYCDPDVNVTDPECLPAPPATSAETQDGGTPDVAQPAEAEADAGSAAPDTDGGAASDAQTADVPQKQEDEVSPDVQRADGEQVSDPEGPRSGGEEPNASYPDDVQAKEVDPEACAKEKDDVAEKESTLARDRIDKEEKDDNLSLTKKTAPIGALGGVVGTVAGAKDKGRAGQVGAGGNAVKEIAGAYDKIARDQKAAKAAAAKVQISQRDLARKQDILDKCLDKAQGVE